MRRVRCSAPGRNRPKFDRVRDRALIVCNDLWNAVWNGMAMSTEHRLRFAALFTCENCTKDTPPL